MKQVLTFEKEVQISQKLAQPLYFAMSRYADTLTVIANQNGTVGSVLEGRVVEAAGLIIEEDQEELEGQEKAPLYEIEVLFGSSEMQFYEVWLRRLMGLIWQEKGSKDQFRVILNISLPLLSPHFEEQVYYNQLVELGREGLNGVL